MWLPGKQTPMEVSTRENTYVREREASCAEGEV